MKSQFNFIDRIELKIWTLCLLIFSGVVTSAKEKKWEQSVSGPAIYTGFTMSLSDPELSGPATYMDKSSATYVELKIDDITGPFYWYKYTVQLSVTGLLSDASTIGPTLITLEVENNHSGNAGNFIDLQKFLLALPETYSGSATISGVSIEVTDITCTNLTTSTPITITPENVRLTISFEAERYYPLDMSTAVVISATENTSTNEVELTWYEIDGAEEYEIEWTWIDNYSPFGLSAPLLPGDIPLTQREFELNCSRIQTKNLHYNIPLIYDNGFLVYRIRAIGRDQVIGTTFKKAYGPWNTDTSMPDPLTNSVQDWADAGSSFETTADNNEKNWQFQASYAEDGKKKEVVSYFDGSLRNRQTVTKVNSNNKVIAGEVIYDDEGRAAVEILPVPTGENAIKYYPDFNRNITEKAYSYQDFTPDDPEDCGIAADGMSPLYGASKYFSSESALENNSQDFVPDAENFPFSQIEYNADNTGRIRRKGGVGETFQLRTNAQVIAEPNSSHEMKYFYSTPTQPELNRLFGLSVGNALHYKKNYVIDPNRQVSISYLDPQGRTIATALSSKVPDNMQELLEYTEGSHGTVTEEMLNKLDLENSVDSPTDNNLRYATGYYGTLEDGLRYDGQRISTDETTPYEVKYKLHNYTHFEFNCNEAEYNYPFVYKLSLDIVNDCGTSVMDEGPINQTIINPLTFDGEGNPNMSSSSATYSDTQPITSLPIGSYDISKRLSVDGEALDAIVDDYIRRGKIDGCVLPPQEPTAQDQGCFEDCTTCAAHYDSLSYTDAEEVSYTGKDAYTHKKLDNDYNLLQMSNPSVDYTAARELLEGKYEREWELLRAECLKDCADDGISTNGTASATSMSCENGLADLMADMMPGGQYGIYQSSVDNNGNVLNSDENLAISAIPLTVYNEVITGTSTPETNEIFADAPGIDPATPDWRHPHYFDPMGIITGGNENYKHYFTEEGEIDYVSVRWDSETNTFKPPILGLTDPEDEMILDINIVNEQAGLYRFEPQYLANVDDFVRAIEFHESWTLSLIKYHPEYYYLDYVYNLCKLTNDDAVTPYDITITAGSVTTDYIVNSDGFDSLLGQQMTYAQARSAGFLASETTLYEKDPYFHVVYEKDGAVMNPSNTTASTSSSYPADMLAQKQSIMRSAIEYSGDFFDINYNDNGILPDTPGQFENSGMPLATYVYKAIKCSDLGNNLASDCTVPGSFSGIIADVDSNFSEEEKDLFWHNYMSYYIGLKQKINYVFTSIYAARQGFYNDCIGRNNHENYHRIAKILKNYNEQKEDIWDTWIENEIPHPDLKEQIGPLLKDKEKRFQPYDQTFDSDKSEAEVLEEMTAAGEYAYYTSTGVCPIFNDMSIFLDHLVASDTMMSEITNNTTYHQISGGYLSSKLFHSIADGHPTDPSPINGIRIAGALSNSDRTLTINFKQGSNTAIPPITLTLPSGSYTWDDYDIGGSSGTWEITSISQPTYVGVTSSIYTFQYVARVHEAGIPASFDIIITGTTNANLTCTTDAGTAATTGAVYIPSGTTDNCTTKQDVTDALLNLINELIDEGHLNPSTTYFLEDSPAYNNGFLPGYFMANTAAQTVIWDGSDSFNQYFIYIDIPGYSGINQKMFLHLNLQYELESLSIGGPLADLSGHHITAVDVNGNIITGEIYGSFSATRASQYLPLDFACCKVRETTEPFPAPHTIQGYFTAIRNAFNELLAYLEENPDPPLHPLYGVPSYPENSSSNFAVLSSYYNGCTWRDLITIAAADPGPGYVITFGDANDTENFFSLTVKNFSQRIFSINPGPEFYEDNAENSFSSNALAAGLLDATPVTFTNGEIGSIFTYFKIASTVYQVPTCACVPQSVPAISCNDPDRYALYEDLITDFGIGNVIGNVSPFAPYQTFCDANYVYIIDGYKYYIDTLVTSPATIENPFFLSMAEFGATQLNYGFSDYNSVIDAYKDYMVDHSPYEWIYQMDNGTYRTDLTPEDIDEDDTFSYQLVDTWSEFASYYLVEHPTCPPAPMHITASNNFAHEGNACVDFNLSVHEAYNAAAYEEYINTLKDNFRKSYISQALNSVVEEYTIKYEDKEYQYTLYYYDQAGNLIQTVAPQGVDRYDGSVPDAIERNEAINERRLEELEPEPDPDDNATLLMPHHTFRTTYRYNSLNQLVGQTTPDGGETRFAYDALGRIVASQNEKQRSGTIKSLTYTKQSKLTLSGKTLKNTSTGTDSWDDARGYSNQTIVKRGYVQHTIHIDESNPLSSTEEVIFGLSAAGGSGDFITYGFHYLSNGLFRVRKNTTDSGTYHFRNGDVMKVERMNGRIRFYQNNVLLQDTYEPSPTTPMVMDFGIKNKQSRIHDMKMVQYENPKFSYTCYDALGRIREAGQFEISEGQEYTHITDDGQLVDTTGIIDTDSANGYPSNISDEQTEVTRTLYNDYAPFTADTYLTPQPVRNTRNRVTAILTFDSVVSSTVPADYETAIFYNYDIHGNVDEMSQAIKDDIVPESEPKKVRYEYDLISGNVNKVTYQKGKPDQFIHHYNYDADNRITSVETSADGVIWERDAAYEYYDHGPLARTIIGDKKVQGVDYAYTLQGWLKTVNSENMTVHDRDMGQDGNNVSQDAFGYSLSYFTGDYQARHARTNSHRLSDDIAMETNLYNGNINRMITTLRNTNEEVLPSQVNFYAYDQLNRIFGMSSKRATEDSNVISTADSYSGHYEYDKNGNLKKLKQDAPYIHPITEVESIKDMDDFTYNYIPFTNKLKYVTDAVDADNFGSGTNPDQDIDSQSSNNYDYDEIGQLIHDNKEHITNIIWRVDGKVKRIAKEDGLIIDFYYDGLGNRVVKQNTKEGEGGYMHKSYYTRDAQGNTMAVYDVSDDDEDKPVLKEHDIYGSSRLGMQQYIPAEEKPYEYERMVGDRRYELTNHLGNVLNVITDRKIFSDKKTDTKYVSNFGESMWDIHESAYVSLVGTGMEVSANPNSGVYKDFSVQADHGYTLHLNITLPTGFPSGYPVIVTVSDSSPAEIYNTSIYTSGLVTIPLYPTADDSYRVTIKTADPGAMSTFIVNSVAIYVSSPITDDYVAVFRPDVLSFNDYYPFGMLVPHRHGAVEDDDYRYGFNGKEKDDEMKGEGNSYDYGARMLDVRIGRWFAPDPDFKMYPNITPYSYALSTPIQAKDPNGRFVIVVTGSFNWFFLFAGASYGGGLAIGNDGVAALAYAQKGLGLGLEVGASINVSLFPTMNTVDDLRGDGISVEASGAHLGKFGAAYQQSSGHHGASGSFGVGEGAHISYNESKTVLTKKTWTEIRDYLNGNDVHGMNNDISKSDRSKMKGLLNRGINQLLNQVNNQIKNNNTKINKNNGIIEKYNNSSSKDRLKLKEKVTKAIESNKKLSDDNSELIKERNDAIEAKTQLNKK